jgi:hypothetical protein
VIPITRLWPTTAASSLDEDNGGEAKEADIEATLAAAHDAFALIR